jgi:hypothetical protein
MESDFNADPAAHPWSDRSSWYPVSRTDERANKGTHLNSLKESDFYADPAAYPWSDRSSWYTFSTTDNSTTYHYIAYWKPL